MIFHTSRILIGKISVTEVASSKLDKEPLRDSEIVFCSPLAFINMVLEKKILAIFPLPVWKIFGILESLKKIERGQPKALSCKKLAS
jgi:hypothetical protein